MATKVETFDTKEERNARWEELRRTEKGVVRFSGVRDTGARKPSKLKYRITSKKAPRPVTVYATTYSVGYYVAA